MQGTIKSKAEPEPGPEPDPVRSSPQRLVVNLHQVDDDPIFPVQIFLPHLSEQQAQCALVDAGVRGHALRTQRGGAYKWEAVQCQVRLGQAPPPTSMV